MHQSPLRNPIPLIINCDRVGISEASQIHVLFGFYCFVLFIKLTAKLKKSRGVCLAFFDHISH